MNGYTVLEPRLKRYPGFSSADVRAFNPRARFRGLTRRRMVCDWCVKQRLCSTRIGVCERCFILGWNGERYWEPPSPETIALSLRVLRLVL